MGRFSILEDLEDGLKSMFYYVKKMYGTIDIFRVNSLYTILILPKTDFKMLLVGFGVAGILFSMGCLICISNLIAKMLKSRSFDGTSSAECQETVLLGAFQRPISFLRTLSLPSYEEVSANDEKCVRIETPPPDYHNIFSPRKHANIVTITEDV